jgi:hypothetical protein
VDRAHCPVCDIYNSDVLYREGNCLRLDCPHAATTRVRCSSYTAMQTRCTLYAKHDGPHEDSDGTKWGNQSAFPDSHTIGTRAAKEKAHLFTLKAESKDTQALMELAGWYRGVAYESQNGRDPGPADTPGRVITAIQLEWAAREIDRLRKAAQL